jgi:hypothetical protein
MPRIASTALCVFLFVFSIYSFAEDTFTEINHYKVSDNYISKYATTSTDEKYLFDVNQHYEGPFNTSTTFKVFTKVEGKGYLQNQTLKLSEELSQTFKGISHLISQENYLLVIVDEINTNRTAHRFAIDEEGKLTYLDKTKIEWSKYNNPSKLIMLDNKNFYEHYHNRISFWNIGEDGLLNYKFDFKYYEQTGYYDFFPVVNGTQLVLARMNKDLDQELHNFQVNQYDIDWDNNSLSEIHSETISFSGEFDRSSVNLLGVMVNSDITSIYVRSTEQELIFKGLGTGEISLEYRNDKNGYYFGIDQKSQQIFETGDVFNEVNIDWQNSTIIRSKFEGIQLYGNLSFLTPTLLLRMPQFENNKGDLWQISTNQSIDQVNISVDNIGDLPLDQQRKYLYDEVNHQLLVTGDANSSPGENDFKLYVWDYDLAQNDFSYIGSASCCDSEYTPNSVITSPLGVYSESYYSLVRDGSNKSIARMERVTGGIQLTQKFPLNDEETQAPLINDVFFANENTIVAELFGDNIQGLSIKVCNLDGSGQINSCTQSTPFPEYEFDDDFTNYKFHKLSNTGQFLFAPINHRSSTSHMFFVEFDGNNFEIKQQFPLGKVGDEFYPISSLTQVNQGQDLFMSNGGPLIHFERRDNEWHLTESNQTHPKGELTGDGSYYIGRSGLPTAYDNEKKQFWHVSTQTPNLSGWFQLTGENKGFAVEINDQYRAITTFELTNPKPTIYTGGLVNDSIYYATQDELLEIDFSQFFLNPENSLIVDAPDKFVFENGVLSVMLSNEDIIDGDYTDGVEIKITVRLSIYYHGYFNVIPVNVNDAPELKVNIVREYLKVNESYEVNLNDYVTDPDKDYLTFQATGLPGGYSLEGSHIRGSTSIEGNYTLSIIAYDGNGGELSFIIPITINSSGKEETPDAKKSGSGGGSYGWLILLMIFEVVRRSMVFRFST